jgi:hypothetical protein
MGKSYWARHGMELIDVVRALVTLEQVWERRPQLSCYYLDIWHCYNAALTKHCMDSNGLNTNQYLAIKLLQKLCKQSSSIE